MQKYNYLAKAFSFQFALINVYLLIKFMSCVLKMYLKYL